ncbi:MAG TPA: 3-hydroxyacyl-ACP dehydratase FabZ [Clostridia bacterium]|nr:3-hydroxyacyl-ACP dehydratase FabZ [Clostridia bacterium]
MLKGEQKSEDKEEEKSEDRSEGKEDLEGKEDKEAKKDRTKGRGLGPTEIQKILPHRYPFLLVDRVLEVQEGKRAIGVKNVSANEPYFQGHFPGCPVMPAVLVVEAMAQVGAVALLSKTQSKTQSEGPERPLAVFTGIDRMRFRRPVQPGDTLVIEVTIESMKRNVGRAAAVARVKDEVAAEGTIWFSLVEQVDTWLG